MKTVFDYLENIRSRPSMCVGYDEEHKREQLQGVELLLAGYAQAIRQHELDDPGATFMSDFRRFLEDRYGWSTSCGAVAAVLENSVDDQQAWDRYWELVREYRSHVASSVAR